MATNIIPVNISTRTEGSNNFFVFEHPVTHNIVEILYTSVPASLGDMGVQMGHEFDIAMVKLADLPTDTGVNYMFLLSDEAIALREKVFRISSDVFGDWVSSEAWNKAQNG